jgi:hypothetical protein
MIILILFIRTTEHLLLPEHSLDWYGFIGRILGKALHEGILVDVAFAGFFLAKVQYSTVFRIVPNSIDTLYCSG